MIKRLLIILVLVGILVSPFAYSSPAMAATSTFYTSSSDAYLAEADANYNTARTTAAGDTLNSTSTWAIIGQAYSGGVYGVWRYALYFDTSSLPDDAIITSATLSLYGYGDFSDTDFDIQIQSGMPTYPHDPAVVGDYNYSYYSDNGGSLSTSSFVLSAYNDITLSATGLTWISKTGATKLMIRSSRDINGNTPTGSETIYVYTYEQGSGYRPKLEVTYSLPVTAPDITTDAASNIAGTTARLNATVVDDGGEACTVRWGWDDDSHPAATSTDDYEFHTSYAGSYTTGQHPYHDVSSLTVNTPYYFRVEIQNSEDTDLGGELSFTTTTGVSDPSDLRAYPSATSVSLTWAKGAGATNSVVRYRNDTYPTSYTDGDLVYEGTSASYTHTGLERGTTYYYAVWCYSGAIYSSGSAEVMVTTSAAGTPGGVLPSATEPTRWMSAPDYTNMSNLPVFYDTINSIADSLEVPRATAWFLAFMELAFAVAVATFMISKRDAFVALIALTVALAFGWGVKQIPLWIPVLTVIILAAMFFVRRREAA